jgi:hypothetical protein
LKATSTEDGKEERDDYEVARSCSYPHSELKENLLQCVVHNLERKPSTHGDGYLVLVPLVISIVVVVVISVVVVVKIVGTQALFRLEEPSAPESYENFRLAGISFTLMNMCHQNYVAYMSHSQMLGKFEYTLPAKF